jgi:hypothetical protein
MTLEARHAILDALLASLDEEHATAILDHRKTKKCPLTPFAAKLLAKQFALCPDPNAAAEEMIIRGWTGFKADWLRKPAKSAGRRTLLDSVMEDIDERRSNVGNSQDEKQFRANGGQSRPDTRHLQIGFAGPIVPSRH